MGRIGFGQLSYRWVLYQPHHPSDSLPVLERYPQLVSNCAFSPVCEYAMWELLGHRCVSQSGVKIFGKDPAHVSQAIKKVNRKDSIQHLQQEQARPGLPSYIDMNHIQPKSPQHPVFSSTEVLCEPCSGARRRHPHHNVACRLHGTAVGRQRPGKGCFDSANFLSRS